MKYYSTNRRTPEVSLREAVVASMAPDNGLYMPERIERLPDAFFDGIARLDLHRIACRVADAFFALLDPAMDERIEKRGDKYHIDLKAINRLWLLRAGIDPSRIDVHPDCTKCHPERYWSHRAMGDRRGGMAAMICLTEDAL